MGLAERADLIVDFTHVPQGNFVLGNVGPDEPFAGGVPSVDFDASDSNSTGQVLEFRVGPALGFDPTTPPRFLTLPPITPLPSETFARRLALLEKGEVIPEIGFDGPTEALLGNVDENGNAMHKMGVDEVSENPSVGLRKYGNSSTSRPTRIRSTSTKWYSKWLTAKGWCLMMNQKSRCSQCN